MSEPFSPSEAVKRIREIVNFGSVHTTVHCRKRVAERNFGFQDILSVLLNGVIISPPEQSRARPVQVSGGGDDNRWGFRRCCNRNREHSLSTGCDDLFRRLTLDQFEKCPTCGSHRFAFERGRHHFVESGLDNVHLTNVDIWVCADCGERIISIPRSADLMKTIGEGILLKPTNLNGAEIRFLRKILHLKINELAQMIGVDRVTVSRWENEHEKPSRSADRLVRLTYALEAHVADTILEQLRRNLRKEESDSQVDYFVPLSPAL